MMKRTFAPARTLAPALQAELAEVAGGGDKTTGGSTSTHRTHNSQRTEESYNRPVVASNNDSSREAQSQFSFNYGSIGVRNEAPVGPTMNVVNNYGADPKSRWLSSLSR